MRRCPSLVLGAFGPQIGPPDRFDRQAVVPHGPLDLLTRCARHSSPHRGRRAGDDAGEELQQDARL